MRRWMLLGALIAAGVVAAVVVALLATRHPEQPATASAHHRRHMAPELSAAEAIRIARHERARSDRAAAPAAGRDPGDPFAKQSSSDRPSPGALSDAQVRRELTQLGQPVSDKGSGLGDRATVSRNGLATIPLGVPWAVADVIKAGNAIARRPYVYGGGHRTFVDTAYDCSASVSYVLAVAGLLQEPLDSTRFESWGKPGRGRWITIYTNAGHAWMTVAGLRFDTGGLRATGSRWQGGARPTSGFKLRHPPGL